MIDWDYERGAREGYVNRKMRFVVVHVEASEEWEPGYWHARDLGDGHEFEGDHDACIRWCESRAG